MVTGGSRGAGLAIARKLCGAGDDVTLVYGHSSGDAKLALDELAPLPGTARAVKADLTRVGAVEAVLDGVRERAGRLDVFVHSAASFHPGPAIGAQIDGVRADLALTVEPLLRGAPLIAELMAGGPGRIVVVTSNGSRDVVNRYVSLGLAKAALESLVRYLAVELAPQGITVNAVSTAKLDKGPDTAPAGPAAQLMEALARRTPGGRLTRPEDVADVVSLLCHADAGWIQGQVVTADGGLSLLA